MIFKLMQKASGDVIAQHACWFQLWNSCKKEVMVVLYNLWNWCKEAMFVLHMHDFSFLIDAKMWLKELCKKQVIMTLCQILQEKNLTFSQDGGSGEEVQNSWNTLAAAGDSHDTKKQDQTTKNSTTTCPSPLLVQTCPKMWYCVKFCWRKIWHSVMMECKERKFFGTWSTLAAVGSSHDTKKQDQPTKNSTTTCP
jgi:hypothetical protein